MQWKINLTQMIWLRLKILMRKTRTSGLKGHHQLKEFTIIEWKFTTQEYKPVVQKIG